MLLVNAAKLGFAHPTAQQEQKQSEVSPCKVSFQLARQRKPAAVLGVGPHADPGPASGITF